MLGTIIYIKSIEKEVEERLLIESNEIKWMERGSKLILALY